MPAIDNETERDATDAFQPSGSLKVLLTALVHVALRPPKNPPMRQMPDIDVTKLSTDAFRFELTRKLATFLGQPLRCPSSECRRAKICQGDPPDCWRNEPPPTYEEIELARRLTKYHLRELPRDPRIWREAPDVASG